MRTRSQSHNSNRQQQQVPPTFVEPFNLVEPIENPAPLIVTMADNRTMAQLLEAPIEGYEDAIVVPEITANNFELKHGLLTLGAARIWIEKEPPRSILTWDDLVSNFINKFFPLSKTTNLRNEITRFQQRFDETFYEAWDGFNDLLWECPHHGFLELHQIDTFYNALNSNAQDSLNSAAGGSGTLPSNTVTNPKEDLKVVEREPEVTKDTMLPTNNGSTGDVQPPVVQVEAQLPNSKPVVTPISEPVVAPVSALMPNPRPTIPYPSRRNNERNHKKANDQIKKFYKIFQDMSF
ncbi:reverse transcriptase domain-containing protein, partial [Tanacetum coccineum]